MKFLLLLIEICTLRIEGKQHWIIFTQIVVRIKELDSILSMNFRMRTKIATWILYRRHLKTSLATNMCVSAPARVRVCV